MKRAGAIVKLAIWLTAGALMTASFGLIVIALTNGGSIASAMPEHASGTLRAGSESGQPTHTITAINQVLTAADTGRITIGIARAGGPPLAPGTPNLQAGTVRITRLTNTRRAGLTSATQRLPSSRSSSITVHISYGHRRTVVLPAGTYSLSSVPAYGCPATKVQVKTHSRQTVTVATGCTWR